ELGMNHPGEIALLARWAAPTIALVNNAQREHQEFMATVEAVARENGTAIQALSANGIAVFPADDAYTPVWRELAAQRKTLSFALDGLGGPADVSGSAAWAGDHWRLEIRTPAGTTNLKLRVAGAHNLKNALAAAACALAAGCPLEAIARGLEAFEPVKGRSQLQRLKLAGRELTLIDDSYNANPDSMRAAIEVLASLPAPRWLVMGDMGEVGEQGPAFHREVGSYAAQRGIEHLWAAGGQSAAAAAAYREAGGADVRHFESAAAVVAALAQAPAAASAVIKGSRFMKMEQVVAALKGAQDAR
ncbi:MAG TPA: Mur ligase family protein, partial [Methylibium sp.]